MTYTGIMRAAAIWGLLAVALPASAAKKMSKEDKLWLEAEVGALITEDEREIFKDLESDEDRNIFKQIFWARRDPSPTTPANEFQGEYQARLEAAERNFKAFGRSATTTDMAKVFLLLGAPGKTGSGRGDDIEGASDKDQNMFGSTTERMLEDTGRGTANQSTVEGGSGFQNDEMSSQAGGGSTSTWIYPANEALGIPDGLTVTFRAQPNFGYRLLRNKEINSALDHARQSYITNPGMDYPRDEEGHLVLPAPDADISPSPFDQIIIALRQTQIPTTDISFETEPVFFRSTQGSIYIPVLFVIDAASLTWQGDTSETTVFGLIEDGQGSPVYRFEEPAALIKLAENRATYELPLQMRPGDYTAYVGLRDSASSKLGTRIVKLHVPSLTGDKLELSSILMFTDGEKTSDPLGAPGRAFVVGGYRFYPKPDRIYQKQDKLSGVYNAYGYGVEAGKPNLTAQYIFLLDGKKRGQTKDEPFISAVEESAITVFDMPLETFPSGNYTLRVQVTDHVKNEVIAKDVDFVLQ